MHHPTDMVAHTTAFVTPVVEHWLEREIGQWVQHRNVRVYFSFFFFFFNSVLFHVFCMSHAQVIF